MKRKDYQEMTMKVVKLEQKCSLLADSGSSSAPRFMSSRSSYGGANTLNWE